MVNGDSLLSKIPFNSRRLLCAYHGKDQYALFLQCVSKMHVFQWEGFTELELLPHIWQLTSVSVQKVITSSLYTFRKGCELA